MIDRTPKHWLLVWALACLSATSADLVMTSAQAQGGARAFPLHDSPRALPEVRFKDGEGTERSLADFRGKVVLLNIWATWCGPCRKEMPTLDRLQAELGGPRFEVVALSIDRTGIRAVEKFYTEIGIKALRIYVDSSGAASRVFAIVGLPTTILIGRDGSELGRYSGPAEWDSPEMMAFFRRQIQRQRAGRRNLPANGQRHASAASPLDPPAAAIPSSRSPHWVLAPLGVPVSGNRALPEPPNSEVTK